MASVRSPQELIAWQLCEELGDVVVEVIANERVARHRDFCDQLDRAANGPAPHIAEGFGRGTSREFAHYLRIAIGSLLETRTLLLRGGRRNLWSNDKGAAVLSLCDRALDMTRKLLASKTRQIEREKEQRRARSSNRTASKRRSVNP